MAWLGMAAQGVSALMGFAGNQSAGAAAKISGQRTKVERQFEAEQYDQEATQAVAVAQRDASEERRRAELIASRALAVSAANGGASSITDVNLIADIRGEGAYRAATALYKGEEEARKLKTTASAKRYEGEVALEAGKLGQSAYNLAAGASLAKGATSLYTKYK